jgi:hypothetical protein
MAGDLNEMFNSLIQHINETLAAGGGGGGGLGAAKIGPAQTFVAGQIVPAGLWMVYPTSGAVSWNIGSLGANQWAGGNQGGLLFVSDGTCVADTQNRICPVTFG